MRKILYIILGWFLIAGCGQKEGPIDPVPEPDPVPDPIPEYVFEINYNSKSISYKGDSFKVKVNSSGPWKALPDKDWIGSDKVEGNGSCEVSVSVEKNFEKEARKGNLFFVKDTDTLTVEICQEARPFIELAEESVTVDGDGGTFDILFLSNTNVSVDAPNEWIRLINVSSGNILSFEVLRNHSEAREGSITISCDSDDEILSVLRIYQGEKIPHPALSFEEGTQMSVTDDRGFTLHPIFCDMTDQELRWSSSASDIASVDKAGNVSVFKTGSCVITARNSFHSVETSVSLDIKLKAQQVGIMFGNQDVVEVPYSSRFVGEKVPVTVSVSPASSYSDDFVFFSSDTHVAYFENNILHCVTAGKTEIYVESAFNCVTYKFTVFVIDAEK